MSEIDGGLRSSQAIAPSSGDSLAEAWDRRIEALLPRLPAWLGRTVAWLRDPSRRLIRIPAGIAFILGGCLAILPVFGLWMLPLGLALLGEDYPPLKAGLERCARWGEAKWERLRRKWGRSSDGP